MIPAAAGRVGLKAAIASRGFNPSQGETRKGTFKKLKLEKERQENWKGTKGIMVRTWGLPWPWPQTSKKEKEEVEKEEDGSSALGKELSKEEKEEIASL